MRGHITANLMMTALLTAAATPAMASGDHDLRPDNGDMLHLSQWAYDAVKIKRGMSPELDWSRADAPSLPDIEDAMNARPTLSGPEIKLESDEFVLHYTTSGDDAVTEEQAQAAFDSILYVWDYELNDMGYPRPPADGNRGGDDRYDFYFTQQRFTYGVTYGETNVDSNTLTSYIALGSWMNTAETQVTVAHEFFHAVHYTYDALEETWWFEVTATWMEDQVYDSINDYYNYVPSTMNAPETSLRDTNNMYANSIYAHSLSERFGRDIIQDIWVRASLSDTPGALAANKTIIESASYRGDYEQVLHNFRESMADTDRFSEGSAYGEVDPTAVADFGVDDLSGSVTGTGAHIIYVPGNGGSSTTLSVVVGNSTSLVSSLLVGKNGNFTEIGTDTAPGAGATWSVPGFGSTYDEAYVVVTNVADSGTNSYTMHIETPGWTSGGGGGCDTSSSDRGALGLSLLGLLLIGVRLRRS